MTEKKLTRDEELTAALEAETDVFIQNLETECRKFAKRFFRVAKKHMNRTDDGT